MSVRLGKIADVVGAPTPDRCVVVDDVVHDSRTATGKSLFACITGNNFDGHDYASDAVKRGAVALLTSRYLASDVALSVPQIVVADVRAVLGAAAAEIHGHPSRDLSVIGVTGTNGKTTTVRLIASLAAKLGLACDEIGTLTGPRTTPEAPELQRYLAAASQRDVDLVAMEVSSHALDQRRVDATRFAAVGFTNLGVDHLDHHRNVKAYFRAKARLFSDDFTDRCVINTKTYAGKKLLRQVQLPTVAIDDDTVQDLRISQESARFRWRDHSVELPIGGVFNVANVVMAAELLVCVGHDPGPIAAGIAEVEPIPGRFETINGDIGFKVVVDYAHTPDGLESVLTAVRVTAVGRILVVFGVGGDRDRGKRSLMGEVARRLADVVVVTSDNPRGEPPMSIIDAIVAGMDHPPELIQPDRRLAIRHALAEAQTDDVVLIVGKGHETTQILGAEVIEFDDRVVVREELRRLSETTT